MYSLSLPDPITGEASYPSIFEVGSLIICPSPSPYTVTFPQLVKDFGLRSEPFSNPRKETSIHFSKVVVKPLEIPGLGAENSCWNHAAEMIGTPLTPIEASRNASKNRKSSSSKELHPIKDASNSRDARNCMDAGNGRKLAKVGIPVTTCMDTRKSRNTRDSRDASNKCHASNKKGCQQLHGRQKEQEHQRQQRCQQQM